MRLPDPDGSRIVLIGNSIYADETYLPALPEVRKSVQDLAAALTDPEYGIVPPENCTVLIDEKYPHIVGEALLAASSDAEDSLLVYFAGHGLVGRNSDFYLGMYNSKWQSPSYASLRYDTVRETVLDSIAATKTVILDCCFSGRALGATMASSAATIDQLEVDGTCVLTSAPRDKVSLILPNEEHTAFTGRLLDLLTQGIPGSMETISVDEVYKQLRRRMKAQGLAEPQRRSTGTAELLALGRNRAYRSDSTKPSRKDAILGAGKEPRVREAEERPAREAGQRRARKTEQQERAARLLADAESIARSIAFEPAISDVAEVLAAIDPDRTERIARSITGESKALALSHVANALAATDPDRAARLFTDAERTARSITSKHEGAKPWALSRVAKVMAATDPDRAERIAQSITGDYWKASVLSFVAKALAATDPDRAARLLTDAERIAQSINHEERKATALRWIVEALAAVDSDRAARLLPDAERAARSITDEHERESELSLVVRTLAATDPDRAERIAQSLTIEKMKALALRLVAEALAATDPDRAERIAQSIIGEHEKAHALRGIADALAATEPDRAERIARSIDDSYQKASALTGVAKVLGATDPDRAAQVLSDAERIAQSVAEYDRAWVLNGIARAVAATDPDRAERIARSITDANKRQKASALTGVAEALTLPTR